jgi:hypothetical protein
VVIGLSFESSVFSLSIAAALCIGSLSYGAAVYASRIKAAKLFLLNAGLLALIFALLRVTLNVAWRSELWSWLHLPRVVVIRMLGNHPCAHCRWPYDDRSR